MLITAVDPNGPAYSQLFTAEEGGPDIIQSVEGTPVRTDAELRSALSKAGKGAIVTLKVYNPRAGRSRVERVRLQ